MAVGSVAAMFVLREVTADALASALAAGAPLFDVREPDEYSAGHVEGAVLVPLGEVPERVAEFPTGVEVYVICRSGARSGRACEMLARVGVEAINVAGGTNGWIESGRQVITGGSPSTTVGA